MPEFAAKSGSIVRQARPAILSGMPRKPTRRRTSLARGVGEDRARYLARRIGVAIREARRALGLRQIDVAARAGITQPHVSRIERGLEPHAGLATLAAVAAAVDVQLAAFIDARPGADLPRDVEHLRGQRLVITHGKRGRWVGEPEAIVSQDGLTPRSIDVLLTRPDRRECAVVEIWTLLADVGAAMRGLDGKVAVIRSRLGDDWRVAPLLVVRATHRNRRLVRDFAALFGARYPAPSRAWLRALGDPAAPMPHGGGFLWTTVAGDRLMAARLA